MSSVAAACCFVGRRGVWLRAAELRCLRRSQGWSSAADDLAAVRREIRQHGECGADGRHCDEKIGSGSRRSGDRRIDTERVTDFTSDRAKVSKALDTIVYTDGASTPVAEASTVATDEAAAAATDDTATDVADLDMFNNDVRLRALKTLAEALSSIEQKKSILYFSAGMQRSGQDNQVELRSPINSAVRANVSIYAVDTRGLQAVVPGGDARQASGRGQSMFSGRGVQQQFDQLASSQDTLTSLAADTGGRAFTDTNDFGEAFARVQRDMSAYYLLGYSSTNPTKDGRFRRIEVRVKENGMQR